jgi:hypothetical protein
MSLILRQVKGSKLTIPEMDGNLVYLDKDYINYFDVSSGSQTTMTASNTFYLLQATTTQGFVKGGFTHSNNYIERTGADTVVEAQATISFEGGNNKDYHVAFFKNGLLRPCSEVSTSANGNGKPSFLVSQCLVPLDTGDYLEVYVKNVTDTTNLTLETLNVIIKEIGLP